jgi:hypothetical protein
MTRAKKLSPYIRPYIMKRLKKKYIIDKVRYLCGLNYIYLDKTLSFFINS